jgi:hypothetical protein
MCTSRKRGREIAALDPRPASQAADLLRPEDDDRAEAGALDRLDCRDDAERPVEPPALRNAVEMGPRPDPARPGDWPGGLSEEVPGRVDLDFEPGLLQPAARQLVRLVLFGGIADAVCAWAGADRVQLLEPVEGAHAPDAKGRRG